MSGNRQDRALHAVRRLRASREEDSRIGLQQAISAARTREDELEAARRRRADAPGFGTGAVADFQSYVRDGAGLAELVATAEERAESGRLVAAEAERRWIADRKDLRTVELILERRAAARAHERARREARMLDDFAGQSWLRRSTGGDSA
jgi:flagellar export protein FliJ